MKREIRGSEKLLLAGLCFIFLFMLVHDWIPLGSFNDIEAVRSENSLQELLTVTLINAGQIFILIVLVLIFMGKRYPIWIRFWLIIHQSSIFAGVLIAWWIPYLFGIGAGERIERYEYMFGRTHAFLPAMNGITPNTLHFVFHISLLFCIILTVYISLTTSKKVGSTKIETTA